MPDPLRVLFVVPTGLMGGAEAVFLGAARHLPAHGVQPVLACMRPGPLADIAKQQGLEAHAYTIDHRYRDFFKVRAAIKWLANLARELKVDLIHSTHTAHLYAGPASRRVGVPEIWQLHDYPYQRDIVQRINEWLKTDYTIFTTPLVESGYPKLAAGPHATIAPTCIDPARMTALPDQPDVLERLGLPTGPLFLKVARLQEHKGHPYLLDAAAQVLKQRPDAVFGLVGRAGDAEQEKYRDGLVAQIARLGIGDRVKLLGFVNDEDLASLYRRSTALVHSAWSEGYGLTLLEAMAFGVPVIVAAADGPKQLLATAGGGGVIVPVRDPAAMAREIVRVLEDPAHRAALSAGGVAASKVMRVETMVDAFVKVYRSVVSGYDRRLGV